MKFAAIQAITSAVGEPTPQMILPAAFDRSVAVSVANAVAAAARADGVCHGC